MLSFHSVSKTFDSGVQALREASFDLKRGELLSLVGPSGCGKSTALRLMAGLTAPSGGAIEWQGARPRTGFVFQDAALMPWATVADNVRLPLDLQRETRVAQDKVMAALDLVGLGAFAGAYPRALSGGMRMRVSIARALAADAELLLMDEPFAALDEITRERLNDELRSLWTRRGLTIVFVTHSIYESVYLSSRIVVLGARPGRVVADIPMDEPVTRSHDYRLTPVYGERCRVVRAALEMGGQT